MKKMNRLLSSCIASLLLCATGFAAFTINDIRVEDLDKNVLQDSFVEAYASLRAGDVLADETAFNTAVAADVDSLRNSGRVSYVRAYVERTPDNMTLVYAISPRQRLVAIDVVGAEKVSSKKIKSKLELVLGSYVDEAMVQQKTRVLEDYLHKSKYPDASVALSVVQDAELEGMRVVITVAEGDKIRVASIRFEGDRFVSESRSARRKRFIERLVPWMDLSIQQGEEFEQSEVAKVLTQKTTWWVTPWGGAYKPELSDIDREAIRRYYLNFGYLDAVVGEPKVQTIDDGAIEIVYPVTEGDRYRIGALSFEGVTLYSEDTLLKQMRLLPGQIASQSSIDKATSAADHYYGNRGYIKNYVRPVISADKETLTADILFKVREGEKAFINEITVTGNEKTKDEVMRRELAVYPGDLFHQGKVETSEKRLRNLNYFETVSSSYVATDIATNAYDLSFKVHEKAMGSFLVGAGFSSVDSLVGFAEMSHGNFDITEWPPIGDGQKMKVRLQMGSERQDAEVSFVEPWFLDRKLALGVDLYSRTANYYSDDYDLETLGASVSLSKPINAFTRGTVTYSAEQFDVTDVDSDAAQFLQDEAGSRTKSSIEVKVTRDTRDQYFIPTRGNRTTLSAQFAGGPLLGDTEIYVFEARSSHFWKVNGDHVFNLRGAVEMVDSYGSGAVPIFDRLFLGGPNSLRGFEYRDISPRAEDDPDEPTGGNTSFFMIAEYTVPLWEKIRGAVFYDIGAVNAGTMDFGMGDLNSCWGIGARFDLPMFPLRLDYAIPMLTDGDNEDADPRWNFQLGYSF